MAFIKNFDLCQDPVLDEVFYESYNHISSDSDNSDSEDDKENDRDSDVITVAEDPGSLVGMEESGDGEVVEVKLGITEEEADLNYLAAGTEVEEEEDGITVAGNSELINPEVEEILDEIVRDLDLPYKLSDFQRVAVNTIGMLKHLVLVSPTGSGKMDVPLLSVLVLRERLGISKGVAIITQPLTSIMNQKMKNRICEVAVLSMTGQLRTSCETQEDADLSCDISELLDGKYPALLGHPESFDSPLGQHILRELQRLDRLILVCIDEFHQGGEGHWSSFRPNMMKMSTGLRLYGVANCPSISMTATATNSEVRDVVKALGLRTPPVILTASPVQSHIKFSIIRRPSNNFGLEGTVKKNGVRNPGLLDLLERVYLRQFVEDLKMSREPKKAIIFCRGNGVLGAIYSHLMSLTLNKYKDCRDSPFVMNHSCLLPPTEKVLAKRVADISLYLSSNKMLLGIDLPKIDLVIFLRPYNQVAALVQGGGRGGRRMENGKRRRVQVYQLFNSQDFTTQNKLMSPDMKRICQSKECTRNLLEDYFASNSEPKDKPAQDPNHCCHSCDKEFKRV